MTKLTAKLKEERDTMARLLMESTTDSRFNKSQIIKGLKYYLLSYATGNTAADALARAKAKSKFIEENFPYAVIVMRDLKNNGGGLAEIWVRKKENGYVQN